MILHKWIAFYSVFLNIHWWCTCSMAGATWNCCHLGMFCVHHTTMHHVISCNNTAFHACMFSCNLPPALLVEWLGYVRATAVTQGWNGYQNKSQHRTLALKKTILSPLPQRSELVTFHSQVWHSNHWAIPAPLLWMQTIQSAFLDIDYPVNFSGHEPPSQPLWTQTT